MSATESAVSDDLAAATDVLTDRKEMTGNKSNSKFAPKPINIMQDFKEENDTDMNKIVTTKTDVRELIYTDSNPGLQESKKAQNQKYTPALNPEKSRVKE